MKPKAPDSIRGPFRPVATTVPSLEVCEHLPLHASQAHRFVLIRSCTHTEAGHGNLATTTSLNLIVLPVLYRRFGN
jgi:hypothetical protein